MAHQRDEPYLLTPGPLTTSRATKEAMLRDWGSRDSRFIELNARVRDRLVAIVHGRETHVCVPMQGSGTFAVEATLGTLVPRDGKALVLVNGSYGHRMVRILEIMGRAHSILETAEDTPPSATDVDRMLARDDSLGHVLAVYCETTSGILNPVDEIARVTAARGRSLVIDAMSAFGAIPLDARTVPFDAAIASSNKCLEGVPGMGFAIVRRRALEASTGNAHSLSLDLHDQWVAMERTGQWRFTPPTHVIAAFDAALDQFAAEGGVEARHDRYSATCRILVEGMRAIGFETFLPDARQAPIIVTFHVPADPRFDVRAFHDALAVHGYVIYPGKLTRAETFRIGCIGALGEVEMRGALAAIQGTLTEMGVRDCRRAAA